VEVFWDGEVVDVCGGLVVGTVVVGVVVDLVKVPGKASVAVASLAVVDVLGTISEFGETSVMVEGEVEAPAPALEAVLVVSALSLEFIVTPRPTPTPTPMATNIETTQSTMKNVRLFRPKMVARFAAPPFPSAPPSPPQGFKLQAAAALSGNGVCA
jgi:hypothetical protein